MDSSLADFKLCGNQLFENETLNEQQPKTDPRSEIQKMINHHEKVMKTGDRYDVAESMDAIYNALIANNENINDWTNNKLWSKYLATLDTKAVK